METLLEVGLSNAVMAAALAVLAGLIGLVCRRPALVHALWLLVLLKLVTPPLVSISVRPPLPPAEATEPEREGAVALVERIEVGPTAPEDEEVPLPRAEEGAQRVDESTDGDVPAVVEERTDTRQAEWPAPPGGWPRTLAVVWLLGSSCWFALALCRVWRFSRALQHARLSPALQSRVHFLARRMGLAHGPAVRLVPGRLAPMIWGVRRPVLLVPEGLEATVGRTGLETLLLHELAHVRRRDHLVRLLEFVALGLFWWNPVAWYARREMREAEEQCCDAWVVRTVPGTGRTYATALVDALDFLCGGRPALPPLASGLGEIADLKRRLKMILGGKTPHGLGRSNGLVVLGLALFLLPLVPVWGQAQDTSKKTIVINERTVDANEAPQPDLKRIQADIEKKVAELAELKARMEQLRRATEATVRLRLAADALKKAGIAAGQRSSGATIRIEIVTDPNMKATDLQDLIKKLHSALGNDKRITIMIDEKHRVTRETPKGAGGTYYGQYHFKTTESAPKAPTPPPTVTSPKTPPTAPAASYQGKIVAVPPGVPSVRSDKRIDSLEKKLDQLLRELESLRKEIHKSKPPAAPTPTPPQPLSGGSAYEAPSKP